MKQVAPLRYGVIFKKAFADPEIFTAFAKNFLGVNLEISHVETEKSFYPTIGPVDSRFDLFAEDTKNRIVVDIQHERLNDHYDRFLYYHCAAMLELTGRTENYRPRTKVFTLVVLTSGDRHKTDIATIDFDPKDLDGKPLREIFHKIIYLCPKYVNEKTPLTYREWLRAIDDTLDKQVDETQYSNPAILKMFEQIATSNITPQEQAKMKDEAAQKETQQHRDRLVLQKVAKVMLDEGDSIAKIARITRLTEAQILSAEADIEETDDEI